MSQQFSAQYFVQNNPLGSTNTAVRTALLQDTDLLRGNGSSELLTSPTGSPLFDGFTRFIFPDPIFNPLQVIREFTTGEVTTTVTFSDGTSLSGVLGIHDQQTGPFAENFNQYLLDQNALSAAGKTLADVISVVVDAYVDHGLSWADLGFTPTGVVLPPPPPPPEPEPTPPADPLNVINGSNRADLLVGTAAGDLISGRNGTDRLEGRNGDDVLDGGRGNDSLFGGNGDDSLVGGDGNDRLTGGAGADTFVFGGDANDGNRDRDVITDFDPAHDTIVFEAGAVIQFVEQRGNDFFIQLQGDGDTILVQNADIGIVANFVFTDDSLLA